MCRFWDTEHRIMMACPRNPDNGSSTSLYRFFKVIYRWIIYWAWNVGYRSLKDIQTCTIRKLRCSFLFAFHSNYGSILHHFQDKARYWSKIVIFSYPLAFDALIRGSPLEYCHTVWCGETTVVGLPDGGKTLRICITVWTEHRRVTDRRTDILPRHSPRYAMHTRRAVIIVL